MHAVVRHRQRANSHGTGPVAASTSSCCSSFQASFGPEAMMGGRMPVVRSWGIWIGSRTFSVGAAPASILFPRSSARVTPVVNDSARYIVKGPASIVASRFVMASFRSLVVVSNPVYDRAVAAIVR